MKGTVHEIYECDNTVGLSNIDDGYYWCEFETREEVDKFILQLEKMRDKVFRKAK